MAATVHHKQGRRPCGTCTTHRAAVRAARRRRRRKGAEPGWLCRCPRMAMKDRSKGRSA